jgi:hypothetical protein
MKQNSGSNAPGVSGNVSWPIVAAAFLVAAVWASVVFHLLVDSFFPEWNWPPSFLFNAGDRFTDFFGPQTVVLGLDRQLFAYAIPPFSHTFYSLFLVLTRSFNTAASYLVWLVMQGGMHALVTMRTSGDDWVRRIVFGALFFSYPVLCCLDRGNWAYVVSALIVLSYLELLAGRGFTAGLALAVAINLKISPALFCLLFIAERNWRALLWCAATSVFLCAFGLTVSLLVIPGYRPDLFLLGLRAYDELYTIQHNGWAYGISLLGMVKFLVWPMSLSQSESLAEWYGWFAKGVALACCGAAWLPIRRGFPLLCVAFCVAPPVMSEYYLCLPLLMLPAIGDGLMRDGLRPWNTAALALLLVAISPKDYYYLTNVPHEPVSISVVLTPLFLVGFAAACWMATRNMSLGRAESTPVQA